MLLILKNYATAEEKIHHFSPVPLKRNENSSNAIYFLKFLRKVFTCNPYSKHFKEEKANVTWALQQFPIFTVDILYNNTAENRIKGPT